MNPLRILILIVLFYILFKLLIKGKKRPATSRKEHLAAHDILVEDPTCKTLIPKQQALPLNNNGETLYFCSAECRDKYQANKGE